MPGKKNNKAKEEKPKEVVPVETSPTAAVAKGKKQNKKEEPKPEPVEDDSGWTVAASVSSKKKNKRVAAQGASGYPPAATPQEKAVPGLAAAKPEAAPAPAQTIGTDYRKAAQDAISKVDAFNEAQAANAAKGWPGAAKPGDAPAEPQAKIPLPQSKIGAVIGPKGATINMIKEKTGVTKIDTQGGFVTLAGPQEAVAMATTAIKDLIAKGYCSLQYDDFNEGSVQALTSQFAELIGPKGAIVRAIKEHCGVEIQFPPSEPKGMGKGSGGKGGGQDWWKKHKITLAGPKDKVEEAKAAMNQILAVHHSEITHPGMTHKEVLVKSWLYSYIIGSKGSELKHIQSNFKVQVYIPRDATKEDEPVLVVGLPDNVERASKYIEKVCHNAEFAPKGREKAEQGDGDDYADGPQEAWMDQYMYKRK